MVCNLAMNSATRVSVTFAAPGSRANPIPLGREAEAGKHGGWRLKINSVIADGTSQVLAASLHNRPPPTGKQDVLVLVSATPNAGALGLDVLPLIDHMYVRVGADGSSNPEWCGTLPNPDLSKQGTPSYVLGFASIIIQTGHTATGYVCFQTPRPAANRLLLYVEPPQRDPYEFVDYSTPDAQAVWFALQ
jgi:hypothetical protein